jgi:RluA family pseudouridine synthase
LSEEKHRLEVPKSAAGERLDRFLAEALGDVEPPFSRRRLRRLITAGAVYVDGRRVQVQSRSLRPGMVVEVVLTGEAPSAVAPPLEAERVLYEDDHLLAVDKPAGLPVQATRGDALNHLEARARSYLVARHGSGAYLALHHRLDRGTSGVVIFAKSRDANPGLADLFREHLVRKRYLARVLCEDGEPPAEWTVENRLDTQRSEGKRFSLAVSDGGRRSLTRFRLLRFEPSSEALVEAFPETGRMHQVRVHLADVGCPVLGDRLYGPPSTASRLMLHAWSLAFDHPVTGERLVIRSPLPDDLVAAAASLERLAGSGPNGREDGTC